MTLMTSIEPQDWRDLENSVAGILQECGMAVQQQVHLPLPRGAVDIDVLAEDTVDGITHRIVCECKNWRTNVPQEKVHAFRTIMQETGANRGYIISRTGFHAGAHDAAQATNIELVTYAHFRSDISRNGSTHASGPSSAPSGISTSITNRSAGPAITSCGTTNSARPTMPSGANTALPARC